MADFAPTLFTERLTLKNISPDDTADIVSWRSDPAVYRYFLTAKPLTPEEHEDWYRKSYRKNSDRIDWMAFDKDGHRVGVFGVKKIPEEELRWGSARDSDSQDSIRIPDNDSPVLTTTNATCETGSDIESRFPIAEVSYILAPDARGQGYASEAVENLFRFLELIWGCRTTVAIIHEDNSASRHFAERLGMTNELTGAANEHNNSFFIYRKKLHPQRPVFIRADANSTIGSGHVMRCLSIATQLEKLGQPVVFVTADENPRELISRKSFFQIALNSRWDDLMSEADSFAQLIRTAKPAALLVDSYSVSRAYFEKLKESNECSINKIESNDSSTNQKKESSISQKGVRTFYIDDLAADTYPITDLVNYNIYGADLDYSGYREQGTRLYLGPSYAPLREEFDKIGPREFRGLHKILVTSGGSDSLDFIGHFLEAVLGEGREALIDLENLDYFCILGAFNKNTDRLEERFGSRSNIHFLRNVQNMSQIMLECDAAVTAGGSTTYEICACGLPAVIYTMADNQEGIARSFFDRSLIPWAGDIRMDMPGCIHNAEQELLRLCDASYWIEKSRALQTIVDGQGAMRFAQLIVCETNKEVNSD